MRQITITGGNGFIASHLVPLLVKEGFRVRVVSRTPNSNGSESGVEDWAGDCTDESFFARACEGSEIVCHFAGTTNPASTWDSPEAEVEPTIMTTVRVCRSAATAGARRFVLASSAGTVYGAHQQPVNENDAPKPNSPHGIAKLSAEMFAQSICEKEGIELDILRISNPYGPGQRWLARQGVVAIWLARIAQGLPLEVYGGNNERDFIYVRDVAHLAAMIIIRSNKGEIFNIARGETIKLSELVVMLQRILAIEFEYQIHDARPFDSPPTRLENSKIRHAFPDFEFTALEDGMLRTWEWISSQLTHD